MASENTPGGLAVASRPDSIRLNRNLAEFTRAMYRYQQYDRSQKTLVACLTDLVASKL